jgi:hypothetical protein
MGETPVVQRDSRSTHRAHLGRYALVDGADRRESSAITAFLRSDDLKKRLQELGVVIVGRPVNT